MANADVSMKINISDTFLTKSNKLRDNILKNITESSLKIAVFNGAEPGSNRRHHAWKAQYSI